MTKDKLKLDCTGCGSSLFQTENPQVYKCERCDTSFKIRFDNDGINLVMIEKKFKTLVEDILTFKEKIKRNDLKLNCVICGLSIYQTSIIEVYECKECQVYYKPIFDEGEIKLVKPDKKTINLIELEKKQDNLAVVISRLDIATKEKGKSISGGCLITGIIIIGVSLLVFVIINEIPFTAFAPFAVILSVAIIITLFNYKSSNRKSKLINDLLQEKTDLEKEITSIENILRDT